MKAKIKITLPKQIAEVEREVQKRKDVYPRLVHSCKITQAQADYHLECMEAIKRTLEWLQENEQEVREFARIRKNGEDPNG